MSKTEVNPKCRDKEKIKEGVIKMNNLLERVKITGCTHCRGSFKKYVCWGGDGGGSLKSEQRRTGGGGS